MSNKDWWRGAVIYQIYPRSYQDSNGDGIGDLPGITRRLEHIAKLGVDGIWISPFFTSPMKDFGYDVSDYCDIDPMFGTLADFDAMVARAHELGLKVLIDLVLSHTSDQHDWFKTSRESRDNDKANWYVWADPRPDGTPPNNWLSIFGGSAWQWDSRRMQYYLHNFLTSQPDLNFHEPAVQDALLDVTRFWLDRGVDGFRLDTVNFYMHDAQLRDNPPVTAEDMNSDTAPAVNPYNFQNHLYSKTQPENLNFLRKFRAVMDEYEAITSVGEVGEAQRGLEVQRDYTQGDDLLHMCYGFEFLSGDSLSAEKVDAVIGRFEAEAPDSWACWAFSNHDVIRHGTRWSLDEGGQRVYAALLLSLRGSVCLYQGEELGLTEADVAFEDLQDPYGIEFWPKFKGRDGCRTPMVWTQDNQYGGFSDAKPWLPVSPEHLPKAVGGQGPGGLMEFYRAMIAFRKAHGEMAKGSFELVMAENGLVAFIRADGPARMLCMFNLSDTSRAMPLPDGDWRAATGDPFGLAQEAGTIHLPPQSAYFAQG